MILKKLSKSDLKSRLIKLMDDVKVHLNKEPDVDKFLDETNLFDDWELALPQHEYPILVMACLLYTSPSPRDLSTSRMPSSA